jgi:two-component system nitrate/nitrite response regulator NarL
MTMKWYGWAFVRCSSPGRSKYAPNRKNGEEAVEQSRQLSPDLIILDVSMPVLGGIEAAQQIRVFLPDVPMLFYSMNNTREIIAITKSVSAQGFVTKDEMAARLLEVVDALRDKKTFFSLE